MKIFISIMVILALGFLSGVSTMNDIQNWYQTIYLPTWQPPGWLFGPVWTTLYILIGISVGMIWSSTSEFKTKALLVFGFHFFFNLIWSYVFFGMHQIGWAFVIIILMILTLVYVIFWFRKISIISTYLLVPYLLWISFASILNGTIWKLN